MRNRLRTLTKAMVVVMVLGPSLSRAETFSTVNHNIQFEGYSECFSQHDWDYQYGHDNIVHSIACPNGQNVQLESVWVYWQFTSGCNWDCEGSVQGSVELIDNEYRAHLLTTSKEYFYEASEWVCEVTGQSDFGTYTFQKTSSDSVIECQS
jgi:hypothetical protein